jgi:hypothetical protein
MILDISVYFPNSLNLEHFVLFCKTFLLVDTYILSMKYFYYISAVAVFIMLGCSGSDITSVNDIVFPATKVSFAQQVEPLFSLACNSCHSLGSSTDLSSWIGVRAINVVNQPGPADTSCGLLQVVGGKEFHNGPVNINANHRQGLRQWVIEGAQNN